MSEDIPKLTAESVVDGAVPSQPVISPDGRWVAYVVAPVGRREERRLCAIWVAAVDGSSPPGKLTAGTAADSDPRWAPDSASVFFLSDRAGSRFRAAIELVIYPREGHGLVERNHQLDLHRRTRAWFDRWLGDTASDGRGSPA